MPLLFQLRPYMFRGADHASHSQQRNRIFIVENLALFIFHGSQELFQSSVCLASWISDRHRSFIVHRKLQHFSQLPEILGRYYTHIRDRRQIRQIENALVRLPVASHKSGTVHAEQYRQILDTDIVDYLVIGALKEGRIHHHHRLQTGCRHSGRRCHRMFLRNSHIEKALRIQPGKTL